MDGEEDFWGALGGQDTAPPEQAQEPPREEDTARENFWQSLDTDPDRTAAMARNARATNQPPVVGREAEDRLQRLADAKASQERLMGSPGLMKWFGNITNARRAHDDIDALAGLEKSFQPLTDMLGLATGATGLARLLPGEERRKALAESQRRGFAVPGQVARTYRAGVLGQNKRSELVNKIIDRALMGEEADPNDVRNADVLQRAAEDELRMGLSEGIVRDVVRALPSSVGGVVYGAQYGPGRGVRTFSDAFGGDPVGAVARDPLSAALALPAGLAALITGGGSAIGGGGEFSYKLERANAYEQYVAAKRLDGTLLGADARGRQIAAEAATLAGSLNAGIEYTGGAVFGLTGQAFKKAREQLLARGGAKAIQDFALAEVLKRYGLRVAGGAITEGFAEEVAQAEITAGVGVIARNRAGGEFEPIDWAEVHRQALYEGSIGAVIGGTTTAVAGLPSLQADLRASEQAAQTRDRVLDIAEAARKSKLAKRDPEAFGEYVDSVAPEAQIIIDLEGVTPLAQELRLDDAALAQTLGVSPQVIADARESTGEIVLTPGQYAKAALTEIGPKLVDHIAFERGAPTPAQVAREVEVQVAEAEKIVAELEKANAETGVGEDQTLAMVKGFRETLKRLSPREQQKGAQLWAAMVKGLGTRTGGEAQPGVQTLYDRIQRAMGPVEMYGTREQADAADAAARGAMTSARDAVLARLPAGVTVPRDRVRVARPAKIDAVRVTAAEVTAPQTVRAKWGVDLQAQPGRDVIVTNAADPTDQWVVRKDIFDATYRDNPDGTRSKDPDQTVGFFIADAPMTVQSLEGPVQAAPGDYIMIGSVGEQWVVKPEEFAKRYAAVLDPREFVEANVLEQARAEGYAGAEIGEAREWIEAKRKGLDLSYKARMERARRYGYGTRAFWGGTRTIQSTGRDLFFFSGKPATSETYTVGLGKDGKPSRDGGNIAPVLLRLGEKRQIINADGKLYDEVGGPRAPSTYADFRRIDDLAHNAAVNGHSSFTVRDVRDTAANQSIVDDVHVVFSGADFRSIHAAFDPDRMSEANILAQQGGPTPLEQFAGPDSPGVDLGALGRAREMEGAGASAGDIIEQTGWVRDPAGQWWTRIAGRENATANSALLEEEGASAKLSDVLLWPELYEAWPFLRDVRVEAKYLGLASGSFTGADATIRVQPYRPPESFASIIGAEALRAQVDARLKTVLIHEAHHAIQLHQGDGGNSSPDWIGTNVDLNGLAKNPVDAYRRLRWEVSAFAAGDDLGLAELAREDQLAIVLVPEAERRGRKKYKLVPANGAGIGGLEPAPAVKEARAIAAALREAAACAAGTVAGAGAATGGAAAISAAGVQEIMVGNAIGATAALVTSVPLASALGADNRRRAEIERQRVAEAYKAHLRRTAPFPLEEPAAPIMPDAPIASPSDPAPASTGIALPEEDLGFDFEERARRYYEPGDAPE